MPGPVGEPPWVRVEMPPVYPLASMWILPEVPTVSVPLTVKINLPFPGPGVLVHELPENALSYAVEVNTPFVTVTSWNV